MKIIKAAAFTLLFILILSCFFKSEKNEDRKPSPQKISQSSKNNKKTADWVHLTDVGDDNEYKVYVDRNSIEKKGNKTISRSKLVFTNEQQDADGMVYTEVRIRSSINCSEKAYSYLASEFYNSNGELTFREDISTNPKLIEDNTVSSYLANFVCIRKAPDQN